MRDFVAWAVPWEVLRTLTYGSTSVEVSTTQHFLQQLIDVHVLAGAAPAEFPLLDRVDPLWTPVVGICRGIDSAISCFCHNGLLRVCELAVVDAEASVGKQARAFATLLGDSECCPEGCCGSSAKCCS